MNHDESLEACKGIVGADEQEVLAKEEARLARNLMRNVDREALTRAEQERAEREQAAERARLKLEQKMRDAALRNPGAVRPLVQPDADVVLAEKKAFAVDVISRLIPAEPIQVKAKFCGECGHKLELPVGKFCPECGAATQQ